ncbi:MAG: peptidoglycan DD-metalloendopeptidase family protein [Pseudomonadota bacterium]
MKLVLYIIFCIFISFPSFAETPIPTDHPSQKLEEKKQKFETKTKSLKKEKANIEAELNNNKKQLVRIAKTIKENETKLIELENNIAQKKRQQLEIQTKLELDKQSFSNVVLAMHRIERMPPQALLARPTAPLQTAQSAMLLQTFLPQIHNEAHSLNRDLNELSEILKLLEKDRRIALSTAKKLESDQTQLNSLLQNQERLYAKTEKNIASNALELLNISKQARNLKDLVLRIERKQKREEEARQKAKEKQAETQKASLRTPLPRAGSAQVPLAGTIQINYGNTDEIGAVSQGLKIKGRSRALVVAPMGGVVDYAGPFKGYGQIVIIRHQKDYHSLVAGLSKIDTVVGRAVSAGEPIGKMGSEGNSLLYYELRHKGQPVNPSKKIPGLK